MSLHPETITHYRGPCGERGYPVTAFGGSVAISPEVDDELKKQLMLQIKLSDI
jgi:hypothetical protein